MGAAFGTYLETMEQFLGLQQRVVRGCLGLVQTPDRAVNEGRERAASGAGYPMLGAVVACTPARELIARRTFDPSEDAYLDDHSLGRAISRFDPELRALAIMPLAMSLEILAEAAAALMPGRTLIELRDVSARRWTAFDGGAPQTLEVMARVQGEGNAVGVQLRNLSEEAQNGHAPTSSVIEATAVFASSYPRPASASPLETGAGRPSRLHPEALYAKHMFHGPLWRGVAAIDSTGPRGAVAQLRVLPRAGYFRSDPDPKFVLDPAVLDAAGQVVGFWTVEHLDRGKIVFPYRLESLQIYGPRRPPGERLACAAAIHLVGDRQVRSQIDVIDSSGRLWMRLSGWDDKRFELPDDLTPLALPAACAEMTERWPEAIARVPRPELFECRRMRAEFPSDRAFWMRVWAHRMLSRAERALFHQLGGPESRALAWLAGRAAAKEAVRHLLVEHFALDLPLADIEILPDSAGHPQVEGPWRQLVSHPPTVAISHAGGLAIAVAGLGPMNAEDLLPVMSSARQMTKGALT
jgi:phosphopantetheinyl transferase (holo-ACP synthase)